MATQPVTSGSEQASVVDSQTTSPISTFAPVTLPGESRRKKGMSIGNAASLFGAPSPGAGSEGGGAGSGSDSASPVNFFGQLAGGPEPAGRPVVASKSPFVAVAEDTEEEDTANLFGDDGHDWLASSAEPAGQAGYSDIGLQQDSQHLYAHDLQQQYQYAQPPNGLVDSSQYASYDQSHYPSQQASTYWDPSQQQQQYGQHFQSQGQTGYNNAGQNDFQFQQPQSMPDYYANEQQTQAYQPQTTYGYSPQLQDQQQQQFQSPYSAPASSGYIDPMSRSQSKTGSSMPTYAPTYSTTYDPYAPSDPYTQNTNQPTYNQTQISQYPSTFHPELSHSQPYNDISQAASSSFAPSELVHSAPTQKAKLLRATSSFFAELPPLPAPKSRPPSAMNHTARQPVHQTSALDAQVRQHPTPPPPPKSRTPAPPASSASLVDSGPSRPASAASVYSGSGRAANGTMHHQNFSQAPRSSLEIQAYQAQAITPAYALGDRRASDITYAGGHSAQARASVIGRHSMDSNAGFPTPMSPAQDGRTHQLESYSQHPHQARNSHLPSQAQQQPASHSAYYDSQPPEQPRYQSSSATQSALASHEDLPTSSRPAVIVGEVAGNSRRQNDVPTNHDVGLEASIEQQEGGAQADHEIDALTKDLQSYGISAKAEDTEDVNFSHDTDHLANPPEEGSTVQTKYWRKSPPVVKQESEDEVLIPTVIATMHEQADSLPLLDEEHMTASQTQLEPFERSVTLDAYAPPPAKPTQISPLSLPVLSVSAPSLSPDSDSVVAQPSIKREEENLESSAGEREAEYELQRAEKLLESNRVDQDSEDMNNQSMATEGRTACECNLANTVRITNALSASGI